MFTIQIKVTVNMPQFPDMVKYELESADICEQIKLVFKKPPRFPASFADSVLTPNVQYTCRKHRQTFVSLSFVPDN